MAESAERDTLTEILIIPTEVIMKYEAERERKRRYEAKTQRKKPGQITRRNKVPNHERPFIMWDGEGPRDAGYALFGSSEGDEICHPYLGTVECLELVLDRERLCPEAIHVWFGSSYDVSMILKDLPWKYLNALKRFNATIWGDYELEYIPHKWLQIKSQGTVAKIFDIVQFWGQKYTTVLKSMNVGTEAEIAYLTNEKARRNEFLWAEIEQIKPYMRLELRLGVELCNKLRTVFYDAGFDVRSWHGPGALANMAMQRHGVFKAMAQTPVDVRVAARYAFAGGRFEMVRGGHVREKVWNADIHSAYPYFARKLPNLNRGVWRRGRNFEPGKFAVYNIRYRSRDRHPLTVHPLFQRLSTGEVIWPYTCQGWYWAPEASNVANTNEAEFLDAWIFDEEDPADRPFEWLEEYYIRRQKLKKIGSPLEFTFKLIINAVYGQLAQRTGWNRKTHTPPKSHQLEWAGYITSACRAEIYRVARSLGDNLISIDTDGIYSMAPVDGITIGTNLGEWDLETYEDGIFWQSGIYSLYSQGAWIRGKTRGIPKGRFGAEDLLKALDTRDTLKLTKTMFIGFGLALNGQRELLNTWQRYPYEIMFGGQGKRYHNEIACGKTWCLNGVHEFLPRPIRYSPRQTIASRPHYLPWLQNDSDTHTKKLLLSDESLFDANHLEEGEEWIMQFSDSHLE
jgi:hypothetical protein